MNNVDEFKEVVKKTILLDGNHSARALKFFYNYFGVTKTLGECNKMLKGMDYICPEGSKTKYYSDEDLFECFISDEKLLEIAIDRNIFNWQMLIYRYKPVVSKYTLQMAREGLRRK